MSHTSQGLSVLFINTSGRLIGYSLRTRFCEKEHRREGYRELSVGMGVGCREEKPLKGDDEAGSAMCTIFSTWQPWEPLLPGTPCRKVGLCTLLLSLASDIWLEVMQSPPGLAFKCSPITQPSHSPCLSDLGVQWLGGMATRWRGLPDLLCHVKP